MRTSRPSPFHLLALLFLASGACGLAYQVLWLRALSLVFGVTVYAASTVLAAFMGGLAVGSSLAAPLRSRFGHPLVILGVAEIGIGLSALATPVGLRAADLVYAVLFRLAPDSIGLLTLARLLGSLLVLLVPTVLMGLTLPVVSGSALLRGPRFGSRVGLLYALNTAGAMLGVATTGFVLIGSLGMRRTFLLAAAVNVAVGLTALWLSRRVDERAAPRPGAGSVRLAATAGSRLPYALLATVVGLSGAASLALEIVWFRVLLQFFAATSYAFTAMLATVLGGIAAGGALAARLLVRERDLAALLGRVLVATGIVTLGSLIFLAWSYEAGWRTSGTLQASAAAIFPAALCMGLAFPVALRLAAPAQGDRGATRAIGALYAFNVLGAIAGALAGGFLLLPWLGSRGSAVALASVYAASGIAVLLAHPAPLRHARSAAVALAVFALAVSYTPDLFSAALTRRHGEGYRELFRDEGPQTAATVQTDGQKRLLLLDGVHQADDTWPIVRTHWQIGHLPIVLHPNPEDVLVVGLGGGATPGAISQHRSTRVRIVELSDSVRRAASFFSHVSYAVLQQPNVRLRLDDGRNFLRFTEERFDIITADVVHPTFAGAGTLYSREYFQLVRQALRPDGLALQWIGQRPEAHYKIIMRTFLEVFPHATLWVDGTLLVGSLEPLRADVGRLEQERGVERTREALDAIGLTDAGILRSWFRAGPEAMRAFVGDGPILTDDQPLLEYHRSLGPGGTLDLRALPMGEPDTVFGPASADTGTAAESDRRVGPVDGELAVTE